MAAILIMAAFVAGLLAGVGAVYFGFRLGFRASYQIRGDADNGLFGEGKEPDELWLMDGKEQNANS